MYGSGSRAQSSQISARRRELNVHPIILILAEGLERVWKHARNSMPSAGTARILSLNYRATFESDCSLRPQFAANTLDFRFALTEIFGAAMHRITAKVKFVRMLHRRAHDEFRPALGNELDRL